MSTSENPKIAQDMDDPEMDLALRELLVADYIVFLFSLDTYMRYLEMSGIPEESDPVFKEGLMLLRLAERKHLEAIGVFLKENVNKTSVRMLDAALRFVPNATGATQRALRIRTVLSRGGTTTARAVFGTSIKARKEVLEAIEASMMEDPDAALSKFSALVLRNKRLEKWIDKAADVSVPGAAPVNPVQAGVNSASDTSAAMLEARIQQGGEDPASELAAKASDRQVDRLYAVENQATDAAKKVLSKSGETDAPVTRSEAIGIATAAVAAATTDPDNVKNIPRSLQSIGNDPQQLAVATAPEGRVLVAAGAGSGKTATLTARVAYQVQEKRVDPSRIMVFCFNRKAADEVRERIAQKIGEDATGNMSVGTMHSTFRRLVVYYGNPEEKEAVTQWFMGGGGDKSKSEEAAYEKTKRAPSSGSMAGYMARTWKECYRRDPPRGAGNRIQTWMMSNVTPEMAMQQAGKAPAEQDVARWYEWFLGFKGVTPNWTPPCKDFGSEKQFKSWLLRVQKKSSYGDSQKSLGELVRGRARLADFSDQILMARDILKRNPSVRKTIQSQVDQILVDEAQDLNVVQHEIVDMLTEHITDGSDGKSVCLIGDEIQSVNRFVGARPDLFTGVKDRGYTTYTIATNYRCLPEIIETANRLMDKHPRGLPMVARPDPKKPRGQASIVFNRPESNATGAIATVGIVAQDLASGAEVSDYAVLSRTNLELNDFETACIVEGIPYIRRGGSSFLKSPETVAVMSYMDLIIGQDFEKMQKSLAQILNKPNRFLPFADQAQRVIADVVNRRARRMGVSSKSVNPLELFDNEGISAFIDAIDSRMPDWKRRATWETLSELGQALEGIRSTALAGETIDRDGKKIPYTTQKLIDDILTIPGLPERKGGNPVQLRDDLMPMRGVSSEETADDEEDADLLETQTKAAPLGNVEFLYKIAQATGKDGDPSNPQNFKAYLDGLAESSKDLRINVKEWEEGQKSLPPSERKRPPAITLSTIHSVKGAQWPNVTVVMAGGVFPHFKTEAGASVSPDTTDEKEKDLRLDYLTERQLAYVALTRAGKNLTVLSPVTNAYGKSSGIPIFVEEAGLKLGQNVEGKNDPMPSTVESQRTVLAWMANLQHRSVDIEPDHAPQSIYDRSGSHD